MRRFFIVAFFLLFSSNVFANIIPGSTQATPTNFEVTVLKIEFLNGNNQFVPFAEGHFVFDIASVNAAQTVGTIGEGKTLPMGSYSAARITFANSFGMTGFVTDAGGGQPARTNTGNPTGTESGYYPVSYATPDGAPASKQTIVIPSGPGVIEALAANGITIDGNGNLSYVQPVPAFSVSASNDTLPDVGISFDVTNAMEFLTIGVGTAIVVPAPPGISIR
jgi:hypothetical protein